MSCSSAMAGATCSFSPASFRLDGTGTVLTGTVTIAASSSAAVDEPQFNRANSGIAAATILWLPGVFGLLFVALGRKRLLMNSRAQTMLLLLAALVVASGLAACGGGGTGGCSTQPVTGTITITAGGSTGRV